MASVKEQLIRDIEHLPEMMVEEVSEYLEFLRFRERQQRYDLESLLVNVTEENLHPETDTGTSVGNEVW